jgi:hypothetical protein
MELRQLMSDNERRIFGDCLAKARANRGSGFREKPQSRFGEAHLRFGNAYGVFENFGEPVERMKAGFIVHDLTTLPQSFPRPELSDLPAESILEGSDLWSLSGGFAKFAAAGAAAVAGIMQARAIIVYPLVSPVDLTLPYSQFEFEPASEPMKAPYSETMEGGEMWVQPLVLRGRKLEAYVRWGFEFLFQRDGERLSLRFDGPPAARPVASRNPASLAESASASSLSAQSRTYSGNPNGAVTP